jgi:parvulin-like peptidyl-prolyl isomerase
VRSGLSSKRNIAILLGAILVLGVVLFGVIQGFGDEDVPDDAIAVVDGDQISQADFDAAFQQAAQQQGLQQPPAPGDQQYQLIRDQAIGTVLDRAWIEGEAADRGVEVTDREVQDTFQQLKQQQFKTEQEYQQFLQQSGLTQEDIDQQVRLQVLSQKIQDQVTGDVGEVSDDDARTFYDANKSQFEQPESRNIRLILNKDEAQVQQALTQLQADNSAANWKKVAAEFSTDPTSKDNGGVREGITEGLFEEPLNREVFAASEGQVEGPVVTPAGTYVFQVDGVTGATTQSFDEAGAQLKQQLQQQEQQEAFSAFLADYRDRWVQLTVCADDYLINRCDNFTGPLSPCPPDQIKQQGQQAIDDYLSQQGCPPPVLTITPGAPGSFLPFTPASGSQPQRPHPAGEDQPQQPTFGAPGGGVPITPGGGATGAPPTGAPPTGAAPGQ